MGNVDFTRFHTEFPYLSYYELYIKEAKLTGGGKWLHGLCPFHDDSSPSFSVNLNNGLWKCHANCVPASNLVGFHSRLTGLDGREAFADLCRNYNFPEYLEQKWDDSPAVVVKKIDESIWEQMKPLPEDWIKKLQEIKGWSPETITALGLRQQAVYLDKGKQEVKALKTPERVAIPIRNGRKELVNIKLYHPSPPKDTKKKIPKNIPWGEGFPVRLFWPHPKVSPIEDQGVIFVMEGEPDTICALSCGLNARTPISNCKDWKKEELKQFEGREVVIVPDCDVPGMARAETVGRAIKTVAASVQMVFWPDMMGRDMITGQYPKDHGLDFTDWIVKLKQSASDFLSLPLVPIPDPPQKNEDGSAPASQEFEKVIRKDIYYSVKMTTQGLSTPEPISNFVLDVTRIFISPQNEVVREIRLTSKNETKTAMLEATDMSSKRAFAEWCYKQGNFVWRGSLSDLETVFESELTRGDSRTVIQPNHVGWIEREGLWLFSYFGMAEDGTVHLADDDGIVWIKDRGFQAVNPMVEESENISIPQVRCDISDEVIDKVRKDFVRLIRRNIDNPDVYLALGFVAMCAYLRELFPDVKSPILYIGGEHQVGKNEFAAMIMEHFGMNDLSASNVKEDSVPGMIRKMAYFSNIPVWADEYRAHEPECRRKESLLRSAFDRVAATKGSLSYLMSAFPIRAPLIISGEAFTEDAALASRCARLYMSIKDRHDEVLHELNDLRPYLSGIFFKFLKEKTPSKVNGLREAIRTTAHFLKKHHNVDAREASVYAAMAECFYQIYNPEDLNKDSEAFGQWLINKVSDQKQAKQQDSPLQGWIEALMGMVSSGDLGLNHIRYDQPKQYLYLWMSAIMDEWQVHAKRKGATPWPEGTLRHLIEQQSWFVMKNHKTRINCTLRSCHVLDASRMPEEVVAGLIPAGGRPPYEN